MERIDCESMNLSRDDVVVVTGGTGCLGQHVVKHLLSDTPVAEIRVFDTRPLERLRLIDEIPSDRTVSYIVGDVCDKSSVCDALRGATAVIHCAAIVDFRVFPDTTRMHHVNVTGTATVIDACIMNNVPHLVFTSTIDVVIGDYDIIKGDETLPLADNCLVHGYGHSKQLAEQLVCSANGKPLARGEGHVLKTVCLRPSVMYGKGDTIFIPTALKSSSPSSPMRRVGNGEALSQYAYVGNVAWSHVCALNALSGPTWNKSAGHAYFVNDDTPLMNSFDFIELFLKPCGRSVTAKRLPFWLIYFVLWLFEWLLTVVRIFHHDANSSTTLAALIYINRTIHFSSGRARQELGYIPKYDFTTAFENSVEYYRSCC